ncbi:MAG: hypothetical protein P8X82_19310 [Gemmatimonadales bacterium]|jgi:hypothetical protein
MNRIGDRISAVVAGVKCPGCNQYVVPTFAIPDDTTAGDQTVPGKRWSFVWREPSGKVCPKCSFPLDRYTKRVKWMRLFAAGVVVLTISLLTYVMERFTDVPAWLSGGRQAGIALGGLSLLVGLLGLVVGGRSDRPPHP